MKRLLLCLPCLLLLGCSGSALPTQPEAQREAATDGTVTDDDDCWVSDDGRRCGPDDVVSDAHSDAPFRGR